MSNQGNKGNKGKHHKSESEAGKEVPPKAPAPIESPKVPEAGASLPTEVEQPKVEQPKVEKESAPHVEVAPIALTATFPIDALLDPRQYPGMNIRSVTQKQGQSLEEAVFESWKIGKLYPGIESGSIDTPPIDIVLWEKQPTNMTDFETGKQVPCYEVVIPQDVATKLGFASNRCYEAIADGNCRTICKKILSGKFPKGKEVTLLVTDKDGEVIEKQVHKTYDTMAVNIRVGLDPLQYRTLQQVSSNRQNVTKQDAARMAIDFIVRHPTLKSGDEDEKGLEAATLAHVGAWNVAQYTNAASPHGAFQEWWRAALSPKDMREGFLAYLGKDKVAHPSPQDFRTIHPHIQMEIVAYTNGETKPGVFWDSRIRFAEATFAEIEAFWKSWTSEQCKAAAKRALLRAKSLREKAEQFEAKSIEMTRLGNHAKAVNPKNKAEAARQDAARLEMTATKLESGLTPDKFSEALAGYKNMATATKQNKKVGTVADAKAMQGIKGEFFNAAVPEDALLVDALRAAPGAPTIKDAVDLKIRLSRFLWESADSHPSPEVKAKVAEFRAEIEKLQPLGE